MMATVIIELEMEIDKNLGIITLPEVVNYLENLIENNCLDFSVQTGSD
jgi:hypothetical protein